MLTDTDEILQASLLRMDHCTNSITTFDIFVGDPIFVARNHHAIGQISRLRIGQTAIWMDVIWPDGSVSVCADWDVLTLAELPCV